MFENLILIFITVWFHHAYVEARKTVSKAVKSANYNPDTRRIWAHLLAVELWAQLLYDFWSIPCVLVELVKVLFRKSISYPWEFHKKRNK